MSPLFALRASNCAAARKQEKVERTMRDVGVSAEGLDDGGRVLWFPSPGYHLLAWQRVPTHTTELGLCTADVISTTASKVSDIKCVTGAHPFPSEPAYSKVNNISCQEHRHKSWHDKGGLGPLEWSHFGKPGKAGRSKRPQLKRAILVTFTKNNVLEWSQV